MRFVFLNSIVQSWSAFIIYLFLIFYTLRSSVHFIAVVKTELILFFDWFVKQCTFISLFMTRA